MRITKSDLVGMFKRFCALLNNKDLILEHNAVYGGYLVVQIGELGSEYHPFGHIRRNAREMYLSLAFACDTIEVIKEKQDLLNRYEKVL